MIFAAAPDFSPLPQGDPQPGHDSLTVAARALNQFTKSRASGAHYSAEGTFPAVPGSDGVGRAQDGRRFYFALPEAPYGAFAEKSLVCSDRCIEVPGDLDDITAAAIANPGVSAWCALEERAHLHPDETVLVNGATGTAGRLAVQLAKYRGAAKVIATGRNERELDEGKSISASREENIELPGAARRSSGRYSRPALPPSQNRDSGFSALSGGTNLERRRRQTAGSVVM